MKVTHPIEIKIRMFLAHWLLPVLCVGGMFFLVFSVLQVRTEVRALSRDITRNYQTTIDARMQEAMKQHEEVTNRILQDVDRFSAELSSQIKSHIASKEAESNEKLDHLEAVVVLLQKELTKEWQPN